MHRYRSKLLHWQANIHEQNKQHEYLYSHEVTQNNFYTHIEGVLHIPTSSLHVLYQNLSDDILVIPESLLQDLL